MKYDVHTRHKGAFRIRDAFHSDPEHLCSGHNQNQTSDPRKSSQYHLNHCFSPQQASSNRLHRPPGPTSHRHVLPPEREQTGCSSLPQVYVTSAQPPVHL